MTGNRKKPDWLKVQLQTNKNFRGVRKIIQSNQLNTVCEEARCPNIHECWGKGTATFMILGDTCTRSCRFCAVKTGKPLVYDAEEPDRVAKSVKTMQLRYVVITSVNRDELPEGGSTIWAATIRRIKDVNSLTIVEVLTPDFKGISEQLERVFRAGPDVFAHNLETVPSQYRKVRPQANYLRSLDVLRQSHRFGLITKTGIMVGLGEKFNEIEKLMQDAVEAGAQILTIGQYLQPTRDHLPVKRYISPAEFNKMKQAGLAAGFRHVEAGALVRSSYHAVEYFELLNDALYRAQWEYLNRIIR
jgi:lipoic acid synthetase